MHLPESRMLLRTVLAIALIGFALSGGIGSVEAQNVPHAPSESLFLPNISSGVASENESLVYDFVLDSASDPVWNRVVEVFTQFGTSLTQSGDVLEIAVDHHGMLHSIANIRCVGANCPEETGFGNGILTDGKKMVVGEQISVRLDGSRELQFQSVSSSHVELVFVEDNEVSDEIGFTCQECSIDVVINEDFLTPAPTSTSESPVTPTPETATPETATPDPTLEPTPRPTSSGSDNTAPLISDVQVIASTTSATIQWKTNEPADSRVDFGQTASYGRGPVKYSELTTEHSVTLSGLSEGTLYNYQITSTDASGNASTTENASFTTNTSTGTGESTFLETFDGDPASPQPWSSDNWDITVHSRDRETFYELEDMHAQHGEHCEAPMATHPISAYEDAVFQCKNHMMTAINASGYGLIYLTPAYQVDFTEGTATIRFDMSTLRTSNRDWIDVYISPMDDHLQLALEEWLPDLSGEPKNAIKVRMDTFNGGTPFRAYVIKDHVVNEVDSQWWVPYEDYLEPSAANRSTFELQISQSHLKFGVPEYNLWWVDAEIPPLDWTVGVVQFGHHSYNPKKDCYIEGGCSPNTWHWDNVSIEPARAFTMIHATQRYVDSASGSSVDFESPAPNNAYLRFAGLGNNIEVSFDNGATWDAANVQEQQKYQEGTFWSYFTPIPAGVDHVLFRAENWWGGNWLIRDLSIWAK